MANPPFVHVSNHTGSKLLGWDLYGKERYRALDPYALRFHCLRANSQLTKEDIARLLLSVLTKYGQIRYINVLLGYTRRQALDASSNVEPSSISVDSRTVASMPVSGMFVNTYVVFVDQSDDLKAYNMCRATEKMVKALFEPHFVFVTPGEGWEKINATEFNTFQQEHHLSLAMRMPAPLSVLVSATEVVSQGSPFRGGDSPTPSAKPVNNHRRSFPPVNSMDNLPRGVNIRVHKEGSNYNEHSLHQTPASASNRYVRTHGTARWQSPSPDLVKTPRDRSRSPPIAKRGRTRDGWLRNEFNRQKHSSYMYAWPRGRTDFSSSESGRF